MLKHSTWVNVRSGKRKQHHKQHHMLYVSYHSSHTASVICVSASLCLCSQASVQSSVLHSNPYFKSVKQIPKTCANKYFAQTFSFLCALHLVRQSALVLPLPLPFSPQCMFPPVSDISFFQFDLQVCIVNLSQPPPRCVQFMVFPLNTASWPQSSQSVKRQGRCPVALQLVKLRFDVAPSFSTVN